MQPSRFATTLSILCLSLLTTSAFATGVPTTITNADTAQFIGSQIAGNPEKTSLVTPSATPVLIGFLNCKACTEWFTNALKVKQGTAPGIEAKFTSATLATSWGNTGTSFTICSGNTAASCSQTKRGRTKSRSTSIRFRSRSGSTDRPKHLPHGTSNTSTRRTPMIATSVLAVSFAYRCNLG